MESFGGNSLEILIGFTNLTRLGNESDVFATQKVQNNKGGMVIGDRENP